MGSSSSKVASKAVGAAGRRQYPSTSSILNSASTSSSQPPPNTQPSRPSPSTSETPSSSSSPHPPPPPPPAASDTKSQHVDLDGRDPQFGSALRRLGPARAIEPSSPSAPQTNRTSNQQQQQQHQPIFPPTTAATNPAIAIVQARDQTFKQWVVENESLGRASFAGRTLLSATEIKEVLRLRDDVGRMDGEIEKQMRLKTGVLAKLAARGVVVNP